VPFWFEGPSWEEASWIEVVAGEVRTGIDVDLPT